MIENFKNNGKLKSIIRESWSVSWAMTLIMFFIFLIGLADVYVAGKFGKEVQASYGLSFQIYFIFLIIAMAISVGTVSVVSRLYTSGQTSETKCAVTSALLTVALSGCVLGIIGVLLSDDIVRILRVPDTIKEHATVFLGIYFFGVVFHYLAMNTNAILRASKMIRKSLVTMAFVCCLNIGLNFYLSLHTPLGFKGIAISTVISLFVGSVINCFHVLRFTHGFSCFSRVLVGRILHISWPAGLLQISWQVAAMVIFLILSTLPEHNVETMAAFTNGLKIESAIFLPAFAFNMANAVVVGNLLGKGENEDAFQGGILTACLGVAIVSVMTVIVILNARSIASVFSDNTVVINETTRYLVISLIFEPIMAWGVILGGGLNGSGDTRSVLVIVSLGVWLLRIPLSFLLGSYMGFGAIAVWWSMNVSILAQTFFITRRYLSKRWIALAQLSN